MEVLKMVLLEILQNLDLDIIDILESYTEIEDYLFSYHGYDNYIDYEDSKKIGIELELENVDMASFLEMLEDGIINCNAYMNNDSTINASSDGSLSCYGIEFVTGARNIKKILKEVEDLLYYVEAEQIQKLVYIFILINQTGLMIQKKIYVNLSQFVVCGKECYFM